MSKVRVASRATRRGRRLRSQLSSSPPEARIAHDSATDPVETGGQVEEERASAPPPSPARAEGERRSSPPEGESASAPPVSPRGGDRVSGTVLEAAAGAPVAPAVEGRARIRSRPPAPTFELAKKPAARPSEPPQAPAAAEPATVPDAGATRALEAHDEDVAESERAAEPPPAPSAAARDAAPGHPATQAAPPTDAEVDAEAAPSGAVDSLGDTLQSEVLAPAARQARAASTPVPVRTAEAHEHHDEAPISSRSSAALESKLHRLDSEFFRESHAPHAPHHVHDEESVDERHPPPSPELLARRSRMRRTVGIVVGAVALVVVGALAKASLTSSSEPSPSATQPRPKTTQAAPASAAPAPTPTPTAVATAPAPSATDAASADASASAAPEASASAATSAEATASASSSASVKDLLAETLRLLNMNKLADAAESARRLVAAAPEDATGYLYLGSALQDLGKGAEARAAFDDCMTFAKTGPYGECAMMGGRKRK